MSPYRVIRRFNEGLTLAAGRSRVDAPLLAAREANETLDGGGAGRPGELDRGGRVRVAPGDRRGADAARGDRDRERARAQLGHGDEVLGRVRVDDLLLELVVVGAEVPLRPAVASEPVGGRDHRQPPGPPIARLPASLAAEALRVLTRARREVGDADRPEVDPREP